MPLKRQKHNAKKQGYMGPKPPWGTHTYTFYVYVLDTLLTLPLGANKKKLEKAIEGHVLQHGTLSGIYSKNKKIIKLLIIIYAKTPGHVPGVL